MFKKFVRYSILVIEFNYNILPFGLLLKIYVSLQWSRSPGKSGSHYDPKSDLFVPNEAKLVTTSTTCWVAMLATLAALTFAVGPLWMFKLYVVPYWVSFMALFLHLFNLLPLHIRVCITFIDLVCI
jgi:fatty acid desaturase